MLNLSENWTIFDYEGRKFAAKIERDENHGAPWDECDGHGDVSELTRRDKAPGEFVLYESRGAKRFYDFAAAVKRARAEGWGFMPHKVQILPDDEGRPPYTACGGWAIAGPFRAYHAENFNAAIADVYRQHAATMTPRQYAARAAMADFERLRGWCNDDWFYIGVIVAPVCDCCGEVDEDKAQSLWGIESDCEDYHAEVAQELANELIALDESKAA